MTHKRCMQRDITIQFQHYIQESRVPRNKVKNSPQIPAPIPGMRDFRVQRGYPINELL